MAVSYLEKQFEREPQDNSSQKILPVQLISLGGTGQQKRVIGRQRDLQAAKMANLQREKTEEHNESFVTVSRTRELKRERSNWGL
ncbi:hypothetical protein ACE6H2_015713 [Prunus campanulata]